MYHILLVEDNAYLRDYEERYLKKEGYQVSSFSSGERAIAFIKEKPSINLLILDLGLEGEIKGDDVLDFLRNRANQMPILVTSSVYETERKVSLFEKGCDDYIRKPFEVDELLARVKRMLERQEIQNIRLNKSLPRCYNYKDFSIIEEHLAIVKEGKQIGIRKKIFKMLLFFANNPNTFFSIEEIYTILWKDQKSYSSMDNTVNVHIRHLRKDIEPDPKNPKYIINRRGQGYCFIEHF